MLIRRNSLPNLSKDTSSDNFDLNHFDEVNQSTEDNYEYFYPPEGPTTTDQTCTTTSLLYHLARLFTSSIPIGYIPTAWKLATLCMLLKPEKLPTLTTSYRPISLMSSIMKLFERVIEQRLRSYLEDKGFINKYQSGFRQNKSTDNHLLRVSKSVMKVSTGEIMQWLLFLT